MQTQIESSKEVIKLLIDKKKRGLSPVINRAEIIAHATLSALAHHWPSQSSAEISGLLLATQDIKTLEHSRWMTQRRIAIAKLARHLNA